MGLTIDLEKASKAVAERQRAKLAPPRDRAVSLLRDVLDPTLSVLELVGFVMALADKHDYVADTLGDIQVSDVLVVAAKTPTVKRGTGNKRADSTAKAIQVIEAVVRNASEPLSKQQVMDAAKLPSSVFATAWAVVRGGGTLQTSGTGPMTRYSLAK